MDTEETTQYLRDSINSIIEAYAKWERVRDGEASREEALAFFADYLDMSEGDYDDRPQWELVDLATESMQDYPLSVDDSHIWFTLGGPNISANVTGWSVDNSGRFPSVHVMDITMKGRWGSASVDVELHHNSPTTGAAFREIAELFEMNLLSKLSAF